MILFSLKSYRNFCLFIFYNIKTKETSFFEISDYYNDLKGLLIYLKNNQNNFIVGYNMENYYNYILNFVLGNFKSLLNERGLMISFQIHNIANTIFSGEIDQSLKYGNYFKFIDMMKYSGNSNERIQLNDLKYLFDLDNMVDAPEYSDDYIPKNDSNIIYEYLKNNILILEKLYIKYINKIIFRASLGEEIGLNIMNKYDESIGNNYILGKYLKQYNVQKSQFLSLKQQELELYPIDINSILLNDFSYRHEEIKQFYKIIKTNFIDDKFLFTGSFTIKGNKFNIVNKCLKKENKNIFIEENLINIDFKYIYIDFLCKNKIFPSFLDEDFYIMIQELYTNLLTATHDCNQEQIEKYELLLERLIYNMSVPTSFTESKIAQNKVYINVALIILKLIDELSYLGADIICLDKTSMTIKATKNIEEIKCCINGWHDEFYSNKKITLYDKLIFHDYENYLIFKNKEGKDDYLITKGFFQEKRNLNSHYPLVIIKAFRLWIESNQSMKEYIYNNNNIDDYIIYYKTNRLFDLVYNESTIQRNIRFIYSPKGQDLYRINIGKQTKEILEKKIQLLIKKENAEIDKNVYLKEAISFKNLFIKKQLELW